MLTNVYYYGAYRPYIIASRESGSFVPKRSRIADRKESAEPLRQRFVINKSRSDEIVSYAQNLSKGVTGLRVSANATIRDMEGFHRRVYREGFESARQTLAKDLDDFSARYNESAAFMQNQATSPEVRVFSYQAADRLIQNRERLSSLGLSLNETGRVTFDRETFSDLPYERINYAIGESLPVFTSLQRHAGSFLTEPLAQHMRFKGLGYHYNYKLGRMEMDGFDAIEVGLLVDKAV